ncbi:hypothetical protein GKC30_13275 [Pseudodesulfovibrio sp. F-1]|uniref:Cobalt ABC transporter permease n=1 Tax=Pseudodesulfovibrio alkaliphilus TaxID=2661613 RepID=A0A7K1KR82_9BACT|nr:hypothetical protein [Pseudodesulfovibrio alkaliphilus]MUM78605.1 hypothetical protein [Pseudodesulfovibrio alkaliphilus]
MLKMKALAILMILILYPGPCLAHKVILNAWIEDGELSAEVGFSDGSPASGAIVSVIDPITGAALFSVKADDQGIVEAALPPEVFAGDGGLLVVGNAGAGHRVERLLPAREVGGPRPDQAKGEMVGASVPEPSSSGVSVDTSALEGLVRQAVRSELAPLLREVRSRNDHGPRMQDIVGGIGYILGLAGLVMLVKGRQGRKKQ